MSAEGNDVRDALGYISPDDRETWLRMGMALKNEFGDGGEDYFMEWSRQSELFKQKDADAVWKSIKVNGGVSIGSLFYAAKQNGWKRKISISKPGKQELAQRRKESERVASLLADREARRAERVSRRYTRFYESLERAKNHPYLAKKNVKPVYAVKAFKRRGETNILVIPIYNLEHKVFGLQLIHPNGFKRFAKGTIIAGNFFRVSRSFGADPLLICEGYATAVSLNQATGLAVVVAFNAGNLGKVSKMHSFYKDELEGQVIVCGDNDQWTPGNPGALKAKEAAEACGFDWCVPKFFKKHYKGKPTDFNDLAALCGLSAVKRQVLARRNTEIGYLGADKTQAAEPNGVASEKPGSKEESPKGDNPNDKAGTKNQSHADLAKALAELADSDPIAYGQKRKHHAKRLGVTQADIENAVKKYRKSNDEENEFEIKSPEPCEEEVDGDGLLCEIADIFTRYMVFHEPRTELVLALWVLHSFCYDAFDCLPYVVLTSPVKRCGKSRVQDLMGALAFRPMRTANISPAAVFRTTDQHKPTLLMDEGDAFVDGKEELRGILNAGYTKSQSFVTRLVGDDHKTKNFSTWGPKCIAAIKSVPETIEDRSIAIGMRRKTKDEKVDRLRARDLKDYDDIPGRCLRWATDNFEELECAEPDVPGWLNDRMADITEPLFAIADAAGGEWRNGLTEFLKSAALDEEDPDSYGLQILEDIKRIFEERKADKIKADDMVDGLNELKDSPWSGWSRGKGMNRNNVRRLLKPFKIGTTQVWVNGSKERGYKIEQFSDAFNRYLDKN